MLITELFLASGMAMEINPCLAPGDMIVSPYTVKYLEISNNIHVIST